MKILKVFFILTLLFLIFGCDGNITQPGLNFKPTADAGTDRSVIIGQYITFDGSGSFDPENDSLEYSWDLGDGTLTAETQFSHSYTAVGIYSVKLTVTDTGGLSDEDTVVVTVNDVALSGMIADHRVIHELWEGRISEDEILLTKQKLKIGYGHASYGTQITTGMSGLTAFANAGNLGTAYSADLFNFNPAGTDGALALLEGGEGVLDNSLDSSAWDGNTQTFLDDPAYDDYNVIIWSWENRVSEITEPEMIDEYLSPMAALEEANPEITFIYMTGHLDGTGTEGNLHLRNEQIREFCIDNNKWLFDFADIESFDPEGNYYLDKNADGTCSYDEGNWAKNWQSSHSLNSEWFDCDSAHSQPLNANMKAYAAWWLLVQVAKEM